MKQKTLIQYLMTTVILTAITATITLFAAAPMACADESNEKAPVNTDVAIKSIYKPHTPLPLLDGTIGTIAAQTEVTDGISTYTLFVTFTSQEEAMRNIQSNKALQATRDYYGLPAMDDGNWHEYEDKFHTLSYGPDRPGWFDDEGDDGWNQVCQLEQFFGIYGDKELNDQAIDVAIHSTGVLSENARFLDVLPQYAYFTSEELEEGVEIPENASPFGPVASSASPLAVHAALTGFDIYKANSYALDYALTPNSKYRYFSNGDCTNFASQIMSAAGVNQTNTWYYKGYYNYSTAWSVAENFVEYIAPSYVTASNGAFANTLNPFDFIAFDRDNNGTWDHVGFVVGKRRSGSTYDYKVAQHTNNYILWSSDANNHWDEIGSNGGRYAVMHTH